MGWKERVGGVFRPRVNFSDAKWISLPTEEKKKRGTVNRTPLSLLSAHACATVHVSDVRRWLSVLDNRLQDRLQFLQHRRHVVLASVDALIELVAHYWIDSRPIEAEKPGLRHRRL